jgi:hypothetical protein
VANACLCPVMAANTGALPASRFRRPISRTRLIESHGGDLLRRVTTFTRYVDDDDVDGDPCVSLPRGGVIRADELHSLIVNIIHELPREGALGAAPRFRHPPGVRRRPGGPVLGHAAEAAPGRLGGQIRHRDPDGHDMYAGEWVCSGKGVTLR